MVLFRCVIADALLLARHTPSVYSLLAILHSVDASKLQGSLFLFLHASCVARVALDPPQ